MRAHYTMLEPTDFLTDVTKKIRAATRRVYTITMILSEDDVTHDFFEALGEAASRDVAVHVTADTFTYYADLDNNDTNGAQPPKRLRNVIGMRRFLAEKGVKFHWLGTKTVSFLYGRTHSKWVVVDDTVYSFGGINLYGRAFQQKDYMFRVEDAYLADQIVAEQERIVKADRAGRAYRPHKFGDETHTVLIDGGAFGRSIIYQRACELAKASKRITYVSQYCPTGRLSNYIKKVDSRLYFNPWRTARLPNSIIIRFGQLFSGLTSSYTHNAYLHAKFIIFDMLDGTRVALTGSHNFPRGGMWVGTREIALETTDKHIIRQLERFFKKHVA